MEAISNHEPANGRPMSSALDSQGAWARRLGRLPETPVRRLTEIFVTPAAAAVCLLVIGETPYEGVLVAALVFLCTNLVATPPVSWASLLPFMRVPLRAIRAAIGVGILAMIQTLTGLPGLRPVEFLLLLGVTALVTAVSSATRRRWSSDGPVRTAVIGSSRLTRDLSDELQAANIENYVVVGRVAVDMGPTDDAAGVLTLGALSDLRDIVENQRIDLLVMSGEAPRFLVFDEIARTCLHLPVRLWELSGFYEDVFGHVPVVDINAAWFQYIMHPNYRAIGPAAKRAIDLLVAALVVPLFLPLLAVFALLIRRDGGPVLFKQLRIGEGGRPLTVYKLRTMTIGPSDSPQWSGPDDARVTRIGAFLRRTHLDEFPQLFNVLKGDMTLVGPRPEQPEFVDRLEGLVAFYQRRHLVKPGITGWAQVRCGYAGSDVGSAWKLSHDLYYIKHRSVAFDMAILAETMRTFFVDRQYAVAPPGVSFILSAASTVPTELGAGTTSAPEQFAPQLVAPQSQL